jgi:hypothetical protein
LINGVSRMVVFWELYRLKDGDFPTHPCFGRLSPPAVICKENQVISDAFYALVSASTSTLLTPGGLASPSRNEENQARASGDAVTFDARATNCD